MRRFQEARGLCLETRHAVLPAINYDIVEHFGKVLDDGRFFLSCIKRFAAAKIIVERR